ncbi:MAG: ribonuclease D, partial [Pseudomonadota bacterium]
MRTLTTTEALAQFCDEASRQPFVTVDTEFLRERTYYAQLCLVQLALPGEDDAGAVLVDTLAPDLSLAPLFALFRNTDVLKVFHAARQDLEIFFVEDGQIPSPLFDTQIAAMVCGYGEQVGYETLVRSICKTGLDKSSRFTDWSRRPLSDKQMRYALADVTHLRRIYLHLAEELERSGRAAWVSEEMAILTNPETYSVRPEEAWKRIKTRTPAPRFLAIVQRLAAYREREAQRRNLPRGRIFKDDVITEIAATRPQTLDDLGKSRLLTRDCRKGPVAEAILDAVAAA